jgi:asparagine synthase (glutamine-hydrolysing)
LSWLPDGILTKVDRMSMAVSLETRVPFLDREIVELAFAVPESLKIRGNETKWLLKRLAERYIPRECVYRPKEGFSAPLKQWIATTHRHLLETLLDPARIRRDDIFRPDTVARLKAEHLAGRRNHAHLLWSMMLFNAWQDRWLRTPAAPVSPQLQYGSA